jgi:hypothetical protein
MGDPPFIGGIIIDAQSSFGKKGKNNLLEKGKNERSPLHGSIIEPRSSSRQPLTCFSRVIETMWFLK